MWWLLQTRFSRLWNKVLIPCFWGMRSGSPTAARRGARLGNCHASSPVQNPGGAHSLMEESCWRSCGDAVERWETRWRASGNPRGGIGTPANQKGSGGGEGGPSVCRSPWAAHALGSSPSKLAAELKCQPGRASGVKGLKGHGPNRLTQASGRCRAVRVRCFTSQMGLDAPLVSVPFIRRQYVACLPGGLLT